MAPQRPPPTRRPASSAGARRATAAVAFATTLLTSGCGAAPAARTTAAVPSALGPTLAAPPTDPGPGGLSRGCIRQRCGTFLCPPGEGAPEDAPPVIVSGMACPGGGGDAGGQPPAA